MVEHKNLGLARFFTRAVLNPVNNTGHDQEKTRPCLAKEVNKVAAPDPAKKRSDHHQWKDEQEEGSKNDEGIDGKQDTTQQGKIAHRCCEYRPFHDF